MALLVTVEKGCSFSLMGLKRHLIFEGVDPNSIKNVGCKYFLIQAKVLAD
jgi:hypothetical protein